MSPNKPIAIQKKIQVVCLFPNERKYLLFKVNQQRGGFWQNITGSVEKGESFTEAALREINEETGLTTNEFKLYDINLEHRFRTRHPRIIHEKSFVAAFTQKPKIILSDEHQSCCWYHFHEIKNIHYGYSSNFRSLIYGMSYVDF